MTKLTMKIARALISDAIPLPAKAITKDETERGVEIYRASTALFEITCENDWYSRNGRYSLTITDRDGGQLIRMYFKPDTLERDYDAERRDREDDDSKHNV